MILRFTLIDIVTLSLRETLINNYVLLKQSLNNKTK
jgi:hypothetical protein